MEQHPKLKVRLGVGIGQWPFGPPDAGPFWRFVERAEELGIDSIWISDRVGSDRLSLDPITAFAAIAGRTRTIKFGPSVLALPLRHPVVLAKEIATIDFLSGGRMLPAVGIGTELPEELLACGVKREERAGRTDEAIQLIRRLWLEEKVTHKGRYFQVENATVLPRPVRKPPPVWKGGRTEAAFRRTGALGDGW